jgi:formylglycine-generating enzyme required for sulfatase activity
MRRELEQAATTHARRALIGERLAVLGDPRPGVGNGEGGTPAIEWCAVAGGEVAIQVERLIRRGTKPRWRRVDAFRIARYPITVAQYRAFIEAEDGWRDPAWWHPDLYRDPDGHSYNFGRFANEPAVYVSWFDAMAFCRWLTQRYRDTERLTPAQAIRLPDEWEWQQAATGGDPENIYPWGRTGIPGVSSTVPTPSRTGSDGSRLWVCTRRAPSNACPRRSRLEALPSAGIRDSPRLV